MGARANFLQSLLTGLSIAGAALWQPPAGAQELPVRISVYATHRGGDVIYHYQVRNNSGGELRDFYIGCDCRGFPAVGAPVLQVAPAGASVGDADYRAATLDFPDDTTTRPPGWRMRAIQPNGVTAYWLEWHAPSGNGIARGQTLGGFSITVPAADAQLLQGPYSATFVRGGQLADFTGPLELLDTSAPTLSISAETGSDRGGEAMAIRLRTVVTDDRDPEPTVRLESIAREDATSDRPGGYRITYSATDASGNTRRTNIRVAAPENTPVIPSPPQSSPVSLPLQALLP